MDGKREISGLGCIERPPIFDQHSGLELCSIQDIATIYRQFSNPLWSDFAQKRRRPRIDPNQLPIPIGGLSVSNRHEKAVAFEILDFDQDRIGSRIERSGTILPIFIGGESNWNFGGDGIDGHLGSGDGRTGGIDYRSLNRTLGQFVLSKPNRAAQDREKYQ